MTTFYTKNFRTFSTKLLLVIAVCFSYTFAVAQCNPDVTPPVAVCDALTQVSLSIDGTATLVADVFDDGSFDNCCDVTLEVRRDGSVCSNYPDDVNFGESITFCCEDADAGNNVFVILQVSDCNGNTNSCLAEVIVEDKLSPIAICPTDTTITCDYFYDNIYSLNSPVSNDSLLTALDEYVGTVTYFDNCQANGELTNFVFPNSNCEDFTIERTWTVTDNNPDNSPASCTHLVTVEYNDVWEVTFPEDTTVNDFGMSTPTFTGSPEINIGSCGVFATTFEDEVLNDTGSNCAKIIRTWTVIDWCTSEISTSIQIINIQGSFPPILLCPADFVVYTNAGSDLANVSIPLPTTDGDLDNYIVTATSDLPNFVDLVYSANDVPVGNYSVTFTITDFCENTASCNVSIQVETLSNNPNCPVDTTINCDNYQNNIEDLLSQLAGDAEAQNESLDQFFGAPSFQNGLNISSHVTIDVDACGQGTLTRIWELDDTPAGDCFTPIVNATSANNGDQICMDVTAGGFDNILSFQYSMNFDPNILLFNSIIDPENIVDLNFGTSTANAGEIGVSWFDNDVGGISVPNGTLLYQVCFDIIGGGGQIAEMTFSESPTSIEVVDGDENPVCFDGIDGNIAIGLGGPNGTCFVPIASSTSTYVGSEVCFDVKTNGFTDILNYEYKVNFDGNILAFANVSDSGNVGQSISYNPAGFDSNTVTWWTNSSNPDGMSVPNGTTIYQLCFYVIGGAGETTSVTFSDGEVNDGNTCFFGIANQIHISTTPPPPSNGCFEMTIASATPNEGDLFCVDATVNNFDNILSFQYTVDFDPNVLAFDNIIDPENIQDLNFGTSTTNNGKIGVSWFDNDVAGVSMANGTLLFQMCFNVIGTTGQNSQILFSNTPTVIEVMDGNEEPVCFDFNAGQITIDMNDAEPLVVNPPPTVLCTQVITIDYTGDWSVVFPPDTTANCSFGTLNAGEPIVSNDGCSLLATTYEDIVFNLPNGGYVIERTWTVINWCDNSIEMHTQIINVNDDAAPTFVDNCNLPVVCLNGNTFACPGGLTIPTPEVMDCSSDVDLAATSDFGNGFGPFTNVNPGQYLVTFTATDPFGNQTTCVSNIDVVDCIAPVAICDENLTVALGTDSNGDGSATIFIETLDDGSYDNCTTDLTYSFAANVVLTTLEFTCSDLGNSVVQLFVSDENGNQNACAVEVEVVDLLDICPADPCDGASLPILSCNNDIQVSLDANGEAVITFDMVLEGISQACIDAADLSFSPNSDIDILNYDCSNLGSSVATVYLTLDNGTQNACWGIINVSDQLGACGDPTDCDNDVFPPTAVCNDGVVVHLMHINDPNNTTFEPSLTVFAVDFNDGSSDNCAGDLSYSFSPDVTDESIYFNCDNIGEEPIQLWVTDANGNQSVCQTFVVVQMNQSQCSGDPDCFGNTTAPVAICDSEVNLSLTLSGEATIFATTIDEGSYDDCSLQVGLSFSATGDEPSVTFDCDDLGDNFVTLYVSDENGNQSQCWTTVVVQDNLNICNNDCLNDTTAPEAFCISALVIQMPSTGTLMLNASLFDVGSSDNCTDDLNLQISTIDGNGNLISGPATGLPFNENNIGANNIVLTVTDAAGNTSDCSTILLLQSNPPQIIRGKIFVDENEDCTYDTGEMGLDTWQVKLEAIDDTLATDPGIVVLPPDFTIDAEGNYTITLPEDFIFFTPDSSVVNVNNLNPYLRVSLATGFNYGQNCDYNYFINSTTNILDTIEIDFPVQVIEDCPQLSVDVAVPYLRRCFDNTYTVNYCNFGNIEATDAYIEVDFDAFLNINSSTLPWTAIDGTTYRFDLGNVPAAECGSFEVNVTVSCDAVLGQTHCVQANIYPNVLCDPMSPDWSGASIDITGTCDGNEVRFLITNVGDNDMNDDAQFIVIEDFIMYNTGTFNLVAGASTEIVMPANGSTWRLEADQVPNHPGLSAPSLAIEGCSTDGNFSLGMVTQFVQNDNDPFVSIHCIENIGSFDPNDKMAMVTGYGDDHYIDQNTDIEYQIRFQNTGTDTAFNVVVIDTLDVNLNPLSVRPGASSHPYDFTILGDNVLKFNFDNIALPDSNVNVAFSQGYVKFRVAQYPDVALETVIENEAAIYFDFNEPIITNMVFHTIGRDFIDLLDNTSAAPMPTAKINIFPNPFEDKATVEITGLDIRNGLFKVYDLQGRLLQTFNFTSNQFSVKREELPSGMYFYQVESKADGLMSSGKLVIK